MAGSGGRGKSGTATAQRRAGVVLPEGVSVEDFDEDGVAVRTYSFTAGDRPVNFIVARGSSNSDNEVGFTVAGSFDREAGRQNRRENIQIVQNVRRIMTADAASRPDGFRYVTSASTADGLGDQRASLYARAGFSRVARAGENQYAIVRNGRVEPAGPRSR